MIHLAIPDAAKREAPAKSAVAICSACAAGHHEQPLRTGECCPCPCHGAGLVQYKVAA